MKPIAVIAIGGNSLMQPGDHGTLEEQQRAARTTCESVVRLMSRGYRVVLTHGNGPQVGQALLRAEMAAGAAPQLRLDECDAETEGGIGYLLEQALMNVLAGHRRTEAVTTILTQVVVDPFDPAFLNPSKPIGRFFTEEEAIERRRTAGWAMREDSGRGWRRVVASPEPLEIIELPAIQACLDRGLIVIAAGGGGIPVMRVKNELRGVEAVIDKDRASALLAQKLGADVLLFSTGVDHVYRDFGKPTQCALAELPFEVAEQMLGDGQFAAGSMGPKIEAALRFLRQGGQRAIVTSPGKIAAAITNHAGTEILPPLNSPAAHRWKQLELDSILIAS